MTIHEAPVADRGEAGGPADQFIAEVEAHTAHNYHPLPVVLARGEGAWVDDVDGTRYLDCSPATAPSTSGTATRRSSRPRSGSSAGSRSPAARSTTTCSGSFARELAELCGKDMVLPMNTGAEAVETALKMARKWGYERQGRRRRAARRSSSMDGNFHGRTTTIVSFSDDPAARDGLRAVHAGLRHACRTATPRRSRRRSTTTRSPSCSSRSRARAA